MSLYKLHATIEGLSGPMTIWFKDIKTNKVSEKERISNPGKFTFKTPIANKTCYSIVVENPTGQTCTIENKIGMVDGSNVDDIKITFTTIPEMAVTFEDTNYERNYARGLIHITRKPNENEVMSYVLSWATGGSCFCPKVFKTKTITELEANGSDLQFYLNNTYLWCQLRRHIILETKGYDGKIFGPRVMTPAKKRYTGFGACCYHTSHIDTIISKEESFTNWFGNCSVKPKEIDYPESLEDIIALVQRASSSKRRIRMTGSGLSASDIMITNDILLFPNELEGLLTLDHSSLKKDQNMIRVLSGTTVRTLNKILDEKQLALGILGGFDGQTITGLAMTATHGSSLEYGPICDFVLSLQVVGEQGMLYQIEPTNGVTDPKSFSGQEKSSKKGKYIPVELIQDDNTFNAMLVSMGTMGIVYSLILRVEPKFWIHEERTVVTWDHFKEDFLGKVIAKAKDPSVKLGASDQDDPCYYEFQVNPYPNDEGQHSVLLTKRWKLLKKEFDNDNPKYRGECGFGNHLGTTFINFNQKPLEFFINTFPSIAKCTIESSINAQADQSFNNLSYNVFNIGDINYVDTKAIELFFDIQDSINVLERMFKTAQTCWMDGGKVHTVPLAGRFVKASNALLSMQNGINTLAVEIIVLDGLNYGAELLKHYENEYSKDPIFKARPHWGLNMNLFEDTKQIEELYPKTWNSWLKEYCRFNKGSFDGAFTDRLGISANFK